MNQAINDNKKPGFLPGVWWAARDSNPEPAD